MPDPKKPEDVKTAETKTAPPQPAFTADRPLDTAAPIPEKSAFVKEKADTGQTFARSADAGSKPQRFRLNHPVGNYAKGETITIDRLIPVDPEWSDARIERAQGEGLERLIGLGAVEPVADEPEPVSKPE